METVVALLGGGGLVAVTTFALLAFFAQRGRGEAEKKAAVAAKNIETLTATLTERAAALIEAKGTIRALNIAIADAAVEAAPVDGSMQRLQQAIARINAGGSPSAVPDAGSPEGAPEPIDRAGDSDLLKPGE